jgi:ectoine hydroxylase-related dioxygenase (phytanoyl-CoA dioxygenase family)
MRCIKISSWDSFPESFVTVIVAIDPSSPENGATEISPGYHKLGCMSPRDGMYHELSKAHVDLSRGITLKLEPGDWRSLAALRRIGRVPTVRLSSEGWPT